MTRVGTLELCTCKCTQQVHMLTEGECGNPNCPIKCQKFVGTGQFHESAFCGDCQIKLPNCLCAQREYDENYERHEI